jgi:hypothetical protein
VACDILPLRIYSLTPATRLGREAWRLYRDRTRGEARDGGKGTAGRRRQHSKGNWLLESGGYWAHAVGWIAAAMAARIVAASMRLWRPS